MRASEKFFRQKKQEIGIALNEVQKRAVLHTKGALLLLASPGSGKTTTIIMKIGYLVSIEEVEAGRIKAVTFSKASASDMKTRYQRFFPELAPVDFSTIHSLAFAVVRDHFRSMKVNYHIIEGEASIGEQGEFEIDQPPRNKKLILRQLYKSIVGENITDDEMDELTTYISFVKNKLLAKSEWGKVKCDVKDALVILEAYEDFKKADPYTLLLDYDDMLTVANQALEEDEQLLQSYQQRYDYVLTDESQDTSYVQHAIIEKLVSSHGNLCIVADDDQSIYSWRGADPSYLLRFKDIYPQAVTLFMEQNYRSSSNIVTVANLFIKRNKQRYPKNMFTKNREIRPIKIKRFSDYKLQVKYLIYKIERVKQFQEVAVLYRNNTSSIVLMNAFERAGIPFYMKDGDNRFFSHWVVEDILNFMRMTYTDKRIDIFEKISMKLSGYLTRQQVAAIRGINNGESVFDNLVQHAGLQEYQHKYVQEAKEIFQQMKGMPPLQAIRVIRGRLGYDKAIVKLCERLGFSKDYITGILNTLEEIAEELPTMEEFAKRLKHLESVMKGSRNNKTQDAVTLSTLHSSKGLEFKRVFMIDLIDGVVPSNHEIERNSDGDKTAMEEAARLFYVGMTRARVQLELIAYRKKDDKEVNESRFVTHVRNLLPPVQKKPL
ncbi:ATP-dependent helicase [Paenibacillaceae bacterium]|nr:ATP-dependent helicase [Paenibacillaceae bacterium]